MLGAVRRHLPTSVWPVAQPDPLPGTAMLPGWLGRTLITLLTTYTRPGDRVLLITSPPRPRRTPTGTAGVIATRVGADEFAGLAEASWAMTRLGRSVQTMTAAAPPDYPPSDYPPTDLTAAAEPSADTLATALQSESGPGTVPADPTPSAQSDVPPTAAPAESATGLEHTCREPARGFDLVVTAAHPHATEWLRESDWDRLLTPTGLAAVITYGDLTGGQLTDGVSTVVTTLRSHGLRLWDHIALLSTAAPRRLTRRRDRATAAAPYDSIHALRTLRNVRDLPITRTHHDLVLLVPEHRGSLPAERASSAGPCHSARADTDQQHHGSEGHSSDD